MPVLDSMIRQCVTWDHLDGLAVHIVGRILEHDPSVSEYLVRWSEDENFWVRRAALLSQVVLFRKGHGDRELFFSMASSMLGEREFFIRKALGWAIREMSRGNPKAAYAFLMQIKGTAAGLTLREGAKHLKPVLRDRVMKKN